MRQAYNDLAKSLVVALVLGATAKVFLPGPYYMLIGLTGFGATLFLSKLFQIRNKKNDDYFPELRKDILQRIALSWKERHKGLKTVVLFGRQSNYPTSIKYIVYCEFYKKKDADRFEIEHAIQPINLITPNFLEAYKDPTPRPFQYEWWLETKPEDWMKDQPFWLLYKN